MIFGLVWYGYLWFGSDWYGVWVLSRCSSMKNMVILFRKQLSYGQYMEIWFGMVWLGLVWFGFIGMVHG